MVSLSELKNWFAGRREQIRDDYFQFLRFRSVSADPAYASEVNACAKWLCDYLAKRGLSAELIATPGYPIVYAEDLSAGPKAHTLLAYGHYDVQPVDPIELWESEPFEPVVREGKIYARGAVDDKGQIFYALLAAICWRELGRRLPVNLKFCIEGEEESHSLGLSKALGAIKEKMRANSLLIVDFDQLSDGSPALTLGARGTLALEVTLIGSNTDVHSGLLGGIAYNPNRALAELLSKLWDEKGRVQVPHFYEDIAEVSREEREQYTYLYDRAYFAKEFGMESFGGEKERSLAEKNWFRPTLELIGMVGGYTGLGVKTVIPQQASAKISCRIVPNQDPEKILSNLSKFLKDNAVKGMKVEIKRHGGTSAWRGPPSSKIANAVVAAASEATGKPCRKILSGASIPIVAELRRAVEATEVAGMGYGLASDKIHAPNEHFDMERFEKGFITFGRALAFL